MVGGDAAATALTPALSQEEREKLTLTPALSQREREKKWPIRSSICVQRE